MANFTSSLKFPDAVQSLSIENTNVRGRLVRLGKAYEKILNKHNYPTQVASLIGELTAMSVSLADSLKYHGQFILQTQSTGPVDMMVANVTSKGTLRSYARYDIKKFENIDLDLKNIIDNLSGQCLHAKSLEFLHPTKGEKMLFESKLPTNLMNIVKKLRNLSI